MTHVLRQSAEELFAEELDILAKEDKNPRPEGWQLSPWAVAMYLMGGTIGKKQITPKYYGERRLIEIAIATLVTDRALLLIGIPGTAKTWVAEHLAAAISGDSMLLIQGTAGTAEEAIRYGWNYAQLIAHGPSIEALVPSPLMIAMEHGKIARVEELTRIPSDVQDALLTMLSEKVLPVPELNTAVRAVEGFNVIATANDRDRGVNELSSALKRRFNTVSLPLPKTVEAEVQIVESRISSMNRDIHRLPETPILNEIRRVVTIFRELREGKTQDGKQRLKSPSATLSTAEAISVINSGLALAVHFGNGRLGAQDIAAGITGAVVKDPIQDRTVWLEYLEGVVKNRWQDLYQACREIAG